jgi:hypothetical protein
LRGFSSFRRTPESRNHAALWIPAFAGMTGWRHIIRMKKSRSSDQDLVDISELEENDEDREGS